MVPPVVAEARSARVGGRVVRISLNVWPAVEPVRTAVRPEEKGSASPLVVRNALFTLAGSKP